ncbi:MFS transporter [Flavobacterium algicola]|uniref:MFS transporter n=1 Tax=Flavobacterium algicola TaxID=556529 RepID=UPI001EFD9A05|nr:MFS transporter [Flavobacterium algicola]MCG9792721.1 MFS transporter [Flavobacterium algicola]
MKKILIIIVLAQFLCTSLWFAGNAILPELIQQLGVSNDFLAHSTSAIQLGFILGTLIYALLAIADRFSPSLVFFISALLAAIFNLGVNLPGLTPALLLSVRFLTGFFLAGIYPIGIKIAADYYQEGLGKSLGYLVGALVLGTAFPHFIKSFTLDLPWQYVAYATSLFSVIGGLLLYILVPDGPFRSKGTSFTLTTIFDAFENKELTAAAIGYFGHMWELYAFWTFVPLMIQNYYKNHPEFNANFSLLSFYIIAIGSIACILSGYFSKKVGTKKLSKIILTVSAICCLLSPLFLEIGSEILFLTFLFFWSFAVIADSPLFSTLIAQEAPQDSKGSIITIVNSVGFLVTIVSIQLISYFVTANNAVYLFMVLAVGPVIGLFYLNKKSIQHS